MLAVLDGFVVLSINIDLCSDYMKLFLPAGTFSVVNIGI